MYPLLRRIFRTASQKQHFKLSPKRLKYLRLIIPVKLKVQPVLKTNHSKFYTPSPLPPVDLDYLGNYTEPHSHAVGKVYRSQKEMKMQWHVLHKKSQSLYHTSSVCCLQDMKKRANNMVLQASHAKCSCFRGSRSTIQGMPFPVQLLRKATYKMY